MRRPTPRTIDLLVAGGFALASLGVVLAPALAVRWSAFRAGIHGLAGRDLLVASALVGAGHAAMAWTRLRCEERTALRRSHIWIASLNALAVLALGASVLLVVVLGEFADEHAILAGRGFPVVVLWTGVQLVAVALAEVTGHLVFRWLEPREAPPAVAACRWGVLPPLRRPVPGPIPCAGVDADGADGADGAERTPAERTGARAGAGDAEEAEEATAGATASGGS